MPKLQRNVFLFRSALAGIALAAALTVSACSGGKEAEFLLAETAEAVSGAAKGQGDSDAAAKEQESSAAAEAEEDGAGPEPEEGGADERERTCTVHICGAVNLPGVYELPQDSRVVDAVAAGGGFSADADPAACNLAQPVTDGCQIYIMTREESALSAESGRSAGVQGNGAAAPGEARQEDGGLVNINTADRELLKTLPGIGDSRADAILAWREENGRFETIEDIMKVSGIKGGAFSKLKDKITTGR